MGSNKALEYVVSDGDWGKRISLHSQWSDKLIEYMKDNDIVELELNYAKGWTGRDIAFISDLRFLRAIEILDWHLEDVSAVHFLANLRSLKISTYCSTTIDFTLFDQLEEVNLEWRVGAKSLFQCPSLKRIFLNKYDGPDLTFFNSFPNLNRLALASPSIVQIGDFHAQQLKFLGIYVARKLASIAGVELLVSLEQLKINECRRIKDIKPCEALMELKSIHLCDNGKIDSLMPLRPLHKLEEVLFYGTTNIVDGDIGILKSLLRLTNISYQNRRHYDVRREEFD